MSHVIQIRTWLALVICGLIALSPGFSPAQNQPAATGKKPNILFIVSDDIGYGDLGPYGGGEGRGMPTPNIDQLARQGMTFFSFYAQPSCTPGRAAMQTGRPNQGSARLAIRSSPKPIGIAGS